MYVRASFLVEHFWDKPSELANGLGVLLLTWNQALYRYGSFDFGNLERCLKRNRAQLLALRGRHILDATEADEPMVRRLFAEFLAALAIAGGDKGGVRSPVATAKALHLLAPHFFPLWDRKIANAYACNYTRNPETSYVEFFRLMQSLAMSLPRKLRPGLPGKTMLKLIDEYNYAKLTKGWA